jgi:hypothetical protein
MSLGEYTGGFIVTAKLPGETETGYLERLFFLFEQRLKSKIPTMAEGHYQTITLDAAGTTDLLVNPEHRITNVIVELEAGAVAYVHYINLLEDRTQDNKEGDKIVMYINTPNVTNPTLRVRDQDGTDIYVKTCDGSGNDTVFKTFIKVVDLWQV